VNFELQNSMNNLTVKNEELLIQVKKLKDEKEKFMSLLDKVTVVNKVSGKKCDRGHNLYKTFDNRYGHGKYKCNICKIWPK